MNNRIGIFDSGIGGLTLARSLTALLPHEGLIYVADNARAPYGPQSRSAIQDYSRELTHFLLGQGAQLIVVACNTATSAAIAQLRQEFPDVPFVGMEPAVKPAVTSSHTGNIGVMATELTLKGDRFAELVRRHAPAANIYTDPCKGLVPLIESGDWEGPAIHQKLRDILGPMLLKKIDTLVLGCTHYPLLRPSIEAICGPTVEIIDPAPATARQTARLLGNSKTDTTHTLQNTGATDVNGPLSGDLGGANTKSTAAKPLHRFYATGQSISLETALGRMKWGHRLLVPFADLTAA